MKQRELRSLNYELERLFVERTAELLDANKKLEVEIAERRRAEETLRQSEERFRQLAENITQVFWFMAYNPERLLYVSPAFASIWEAPVEEFYKNPNLWFEMIHPEDRAYVKERREMLRSSDRTSVELEYRITTAQGQVRWICDRTTATFDDNGQLCRLSGIAEDITERKLAEQDISFRADHDALTGLPNRSLLRDRLEQAIGTAQRSGRCVALFFIDLDRFKGVNDSLGHHVGDQLLQEVGRRLVRCVRKTDTVARLGGDEFVVVLHELKSAPAAAHVAEKIRDEIRRPFTLGTHQVTVGASIGISVSPDDGSDVDRLLKSADQAMYYAKGCGRDNYQFCTPATNSTAWRRQQHEANLRQAVERGEFVLHYQPIISATTHRIIGAEALIRWQHPREGLLLPAMFIPCAEEINLIGSIDEWVLDRACRQGRRFYDRGPVELRVSINVSTRRFYQPGLVAHLQRALKESQLPPWLLDLELPASLVTHHDDATIDTLKRLDALGVQLSLDGFGAGNVNLTCLKRFPVRKLQIDRTLISALHHDVEVQSVISAIVAMARCLGIHVAAAGVETREQLRFLLAQGCHELQGFCYSAPVPGNELLRLLKNEPLPLRPEGSASRSLALFALPPGDGA